MQAMETILYIHWRTTYDGVSEVPTRMYLYCDYDTRRAGGLLCEVLFPAVVHHFILEPRTTFQNRELEVLRLLAEDQ